MLCWNLNFTPDENPGERGAGLYRGIYASPVFSASVLTLGEAIVSVGNEITFLLNGQMPVTWKLDTTLEIVIA